MQDTTKYSGLKIGSVKRDHGKAILTLSNGETLSMPRAMLKERPYKSGMPFDLDAFRNFVQERSYPFAMDKAVSLLSMRARTEKEIVDALRKNVYPEETIARVMARLNEAGYINDADFASQFSSSRLSRGIGARRIRMELSRKGVDSSTADAVLDALESEDVLDAALKAARKAARGKDLTDRADRQKILAALARRGFDYALSWEALQILNAEIDDENV